MMCYLSQGTGFITAILIIMDLKSVAMILTFNMAVAVLFAHNLLNFTEGEIAFNYFVLALVISLTDTGKCRTDQVILNKIVHTKA